MNIGLIYFSPTESTAKVADVVKEKLIELNNEVREFNITNYSKRQKPLDLDQFKAFIFAFPVYYGRAPRLIREWLTTLEGKDRRCSVFFTYGGVHVGISRQDIKDILTNQKFKLVSIAKFVAKHTYNLSGWSVNVDRPNEEDLEVAKEYALKTYEKFSTEKSEIINLKPPKLTAEQADENETMTKRALPSPMRQGDECSMCRTCEELCPANAMNADKGKPNRRTCIKCFRCVANCPDNVLRSIDMLSHYALLKKLNRLTDEMINGKKSKYYV